MSPRRPYATDLSDEEWRILGSLIPEAKPGGRPRVHEAREILDAIFYAVRGGCAWRLRLAAFAPRVPTLENRLDGLITNDKFCFSRHSRLKLRPRRRRYPSRDKARRGGIHETQLGCSAHNGQSQRRRPSLGSGLPASPPMGDSEGKPEGGGI